MATFHRIAVATDLEVASTHAVDMAARLAHDEGATLALIHVLEIPSWAFEPATYTSADFITPLEHGGRKLLVTELERVKATHARTTGVFRRGFTSDEVLLALAEMHADLLIVGSHGRRGLSRMVLGSVAERLVRTSTIPVLVVRKES